MKRAVVTVVAGAVLVADGRGGRVHLYVTAASRARLAQYLANTDANRVGGQVLQYQVPWAA